jgi:hypothetical protein
MVKHDGKQWGLPNHGVKVTDLQSSKRSMPSTMPVHHARCPRRSSDCPRSFDLPPLG